MVAWLGGIVDLHSKGTQGTPGYNRNFSFLKYLFNLFIWLYQLLVLSLEIFDLQSLLWHGNS